jgi:lipopolysaccharide export system permease protein
MLAYYGARVPWFFDVAGREVTLLAAVFVVAGLQRHNEMTALQSAGISQWRIVRPLFFAGAVVAILAAVNRELAIPRVRELLCQRASDLTGARAHPMQMRYDPETDVLFDGQTIHPKTNSIAGAQLRMPLAWPPVGRTDRAERAIFSPANDIRPSGYLLRGVQDADLRQASSLQWKDRTLVFAPRDASWLKADECFVYSRLPVEAFQGGARWQRYASTRQLIAGMYDGSIEGSSEVRIAAHARFVQPFLDVVLLFLGIPAVLGIQRRHVFSSAAKSLAVIAGFSVVVLASHALGWQGLLAPSLASWLPLLILVPLATLVAEPLSS